MTTKKKSGKSSHKRSAQAAMAVATSERRVPKERVAAFAAELGNVERVDVLPFHQMGRFKWEKLGMEYQLKDAQLPSRAMVDEAIARFRAAGLKAV